MNIETYTRKPLFVEAVRVTEENMDDVAKWCGGEIMIPGTGRHIQVDVIRPRSERQCKAYVGDWVLKSEAGHKVYTNSSFHKAFVKP